MSTVLVMLCLHNRCAQPLGDIPGAFAFLLPAGAPAGIAPPPRDLNSCGVTACVACRYGGALFVDGWAPGFDPPPRCGPRALTAKTRGGAVPVIRAEQWWGMQRYGDGADGKGTPVPLRAARCKSHGKGQHVCKMHTGHDGKHRCICGLDWA